MGASEDDERPMKQVRMERAGADLKMEHKHVEKWVVNNWRKNDAELAMLKESAWVTLWSHKTTYFMLVQHMYHRKTW